MADSLFVVLRPCVQVLLCAKWTHEFRQFGNAFDAAHALLALQEPHHRPAQRHVRVLVFRHPLAVAAHD